MDVERFICFSSESYQLLLPAYAAGRPIRRDMV